jgi:hypothetical protein
MIHLCHLRNKCIVCLPRRLATPYMPLMSESVADTRSQVSDPSVIPEPARTREWLVLTHHLPPQPAYFRVKVHRRLERIGAVPLKASVYVLPRTEEAVEDFQWLLQEIEREGGDATLSEARFLDGVTDERLIERFNTARDEDYGDIVSSAQTLFEEISRADSDEPARSTVGARLHRLSRRLEEVSEVDFFEAPGRDAAEEAVERTRRAYTGESSEPPEPRPSGDVGPGRTWVTRVGVREDRIASAWLIRRFIDPQARFKFVPGRGYTPEEGELRFDTFEGEFTHVGDMCTIEVLIDHFGLGGDTALEAIAQIIHDIDCKDGKFQRAELAGVASVIDGVVSRHAEDEARLERGAAFLDDLYAHFK